MNNIKMKKNYKPLKLIEQIKAIKNQFSGLKKKMDEEDKISIVLEKETKDYAHILDSTEK